MSAAAIIAALALSPEARLDRRVPKKMLMEQGAATASDRRQIQNGIEELLWVAALKPGNIGVPEYRDGVREYLEIAVLAAELRPTAKTARLTELIHRAIPYPVVLVTTNCDTLQMSLAHKRPSQNEAGANVLHWGVITTPSLGTEPDEMATSFLESLPLSSQARVHLCALYQGWIDRVWAFQAARITGQFVIAATADAAAARRAALAEYDLIGKEISNLRTRAEHETQTSGRVDLNLAIRRLSSEREALKTRL